MIFSLFLESFALSIDKEGKIHYYKYAVKCSDGGMVDTLVSGTSGLCREGSSPFPSTSKK